MLNCVIIYKSIWRFIINTFSRKLTKTPSNAISGIITKFIGKEKDQALEIFIKLLESVGIVVPVFFDNFNKKQNSFDCVAAMKKVSLKFSDLVPSQSRCLDIIDGELCSQYLYNIIDKSLDVIFSTYSRGNFVLIHCHNKSLYCYCRFDISDDFQILIEVFKPKSPDYSHKYVSDSFLKIKDYLFDPPFFLMSRIFVRKL